MFSIQCASAQNQDLKRAKLYFERTYYSEAIPLYEAAVAEKQTMEIVKNLADSYYFINDMANAQKWYRTLLGTYNDLDEEYYFRYVQTLKAAGMYTEANKFMRSHIAKGNDNPALLNFDRDLHELENVSAIGNRFDIKNLAINTKNTEFGATRFGNQMVFTGTKPKGTFEKKYKWNNESYLDLLAIQLSGLANGDSIAIGFSEDINTAMHEGNAVFTQDMTTVYFTRNNFKNGKRAKNKDKISNLQIYKAEFIEGKWSNILPLPFNSENYSMEHPALSPDEKTLYFASNMPGTLGSFDIFSVSIDNGSFGTPIHLGNKINTARKEQFPYFSKDNKLYFSSNGHPGYGSLDVFVSEYKDGEFSRPLNVGHPVNSGYDDFAFTIDSDTKQGYFSSNRSDGKGSDDIYSLNETEPLIIEDCMQFIEGVITDIDTKLPLENAIVILEDNSKKELQRSITGIDGKFKFTVACNANYVVLASKFDYTKDSKSVKTNTIRRKANDASMALKSEELIRKAAELAEKQKKKEQEIAEKEKEKQRVIDILAKEKDIVKDKDRLIIKTDPIYFDYDLWYIRKESKIILDRVVELMKKYPKMVVEIGSHTDVRGNNKYNLDLSSKRAASTRVYIIQQGVPAKRVFSKGYGETVQIVKCVPEESCSEEQHELNRRSEFVIKNL